MTSNYSEIMQFDTFENKIGVCFRFPSDNTVSVKKPITKMILETQTAAPSVGGTGDLFASLLIAHWLHQKLNKRSNLVDKTTVINSTVKILARVMKMVECENISDLPFRKLMRIQ